MQTRATKVFLPQNYEQYLLQKKKMNRLLQSKHTFTHNDNFSHHPQKQNNFLNAQTNRDSFSPSNRNQSMTSSYGQSYLGSMNGTKTAEINVKNEIQANSDNDDFTSGYQKQQKSKIVQTIIYSEYKSLFQDFENNKFDAIKKKIQQQLQRLKQQTPLEPLKVNSILKKIQLQSFQNIRQIQKQLQQPFGKRNAQKLDQMLNFNKFFVILNKGIQSINHIFLDKRFRIYQNCTLKKYKPNQVVYREGELNQHMYVVIKGCIKQYQTKSTSYQQKVEVNFVSYYEGSNFGEAPLVGDPEMKGKRYNTTQTTEETYLLLLANSFYKQLITNSAEDDFEKKIQALMQTTIFRDTSKMFVTPLLPTLAKMDLAYGTVLIRQGQQVRHLYFVAEGNLQVMLLDRAKRNIKHMNIEQKPKNFYVKKTQQPKQKQKNKSYSIHTKFYYPEVTENQQKQFLYGNKKLIGQNQLQYNDQVIFQTLRVGDFIGGKSFLQQIQREKKMMNSQYFDTSLKAKLSVLSSSPKTVVYAIDQKKFFSLSDNFQKMIVQGILEAKYFDEQNIEVKAQGEKQWKKYAEKLVGNVLTAKKNSRSSSFRI